MNNYQDTAGNYNAWNCNRYGVIQLIYYNLLGRIEWLSSRVVSVLDSDAEGPGFQSQPRRCQVTVLGKLFTPVVPLFTKQRN